MCNVCTVTYCNFVCVNDGDQPKRINQVHLFLHFELPHLSGEKQHVLFRSWTLQVGNSDRALTDGVSPFCKGRKTQRDGGVWKLGGVGKDWDRCEWHHLETLFLSPGPG